MHKRLFALLLLFPLAMPLAAADLQLPDRHPLDESEYRKFQLENGLRVLLLSDPKLNKSAVSVAVDAGSLLDPEERQGLAHFLEHMLFLGTAKYPGADEYSEFLTQNGGYNNAYTSNDISNYHFEVAHHALDEGIDRLAQFFISPLFSADYSEREMNAVNSEFNNYVEEDGWRLYQLGRNYVREGHPENSFNVGNAETLDEVRREEFISYYEKQYSANQMAVAVIGEASLDDMESWVRRSFGPVESNGRDRNDYSSDLYPELGGIRIVQAKPIKENRSLRISFEWPSIYPYVDFKPATIISHVLGYEGKGSLTAFLKERGLINGLGTGISNATANYSEFSVNVDLTPEGFSRYREVAEAIFAYIDLMRGASFPQQTYEEIAAIAAIDEIYRDKGDGAGRATQLANNALTFGLDNAERVEFIYKDPDESVYFDLLERLVPTNAMMMLVGPEVETDRTESIYGTEYSTGVEQGEFLERLRSPKTIAALTMPPANPFIPESVSTLPEQPVLIVDEPGLELFYLLDTEFLRPRVALRFQLRQGEDMADIEDVVLKDFYTASFQAMVNEVGYDAAQAGLNYDVSADYEGVSLTMVGYVDSIEALLNYLIDNLNTIELSDERFAAIRDRIIRNYENFEKSAAYQVTAAQRRQFLYDRYFLPSEMLPVAMDVTLKDVQKYARKLFTKGHVEALVHGHVDADQAEAFARRFTEGLDLKPLRKKDVYERRILIQENPEDIIWTGRRESLANSCFWMDYRIGPDTPKHAAAAMVIDNFIQTPYYNEMRTTQQLGYIVWSFATTIEDEVMAGFVIQSSDYPADELAKRSEAFVPSLVKDFEGIEDAKFSELKAAVRAKLEEEEKTIAGKAGLLFNRAFEHNRDWDRREEILDALEALQKSEVSALMSQTFNPETRRTTKFLNFGSGHQPSEETKATVENIESWKRGRKFM